MVFLIIFLSSQSSLSKSVIFSNFEKRACYFWKPLLPFTRSVMMETFAAVSDLAYPLTKLSGVSGVHTHPYLNMYILIYITSNNTFGRFCFSFLLTMSQLVSNQSARTASFYFTWEYASMARTRLSPRSSRRAIYCWL